MIYNANILLIYHIYLNFFINIITTTEMITCVREHWQVLIIIFVEKNLFICDEIRLSVIR